MHIANGKVIPPEADVRIWRHGHILILRRDSAFPPRCIKCNAPTPSPQHRVCLASPDYFSFSGSGGIEFLLELLMVLFATLFWRKRVYFTVGLCPVHQQRLQKGRRTIRLAFALSALAIVAAIFIPAINQNTLYMLAVIVPAVVMSLSLVIYASADCNLLTVTTIDKERVGAKGCCSEFLDELPDARELATDHP